jgi:ABC-type transport system involved in cytochrome c biogenesis permease subunit
MAKDSIMLIVSVMAVLMYTFWWRWERNETENTFNNYLYSDRNTIKDNLK